MRKRANANLADGLYSPSTKSTLGPPSVNYAREGFDMKVFLGTVRAAEVENRIQVLEARYCSTILPLYEE